METLLHKIVANLRAGNTTDHAFLEKSIRAANKGVTAHVKPYSKKRLCGYYTTLEQTHPQVWSDLALTEAEIKQLNSLLQMKPRRTGSGVATITVITKPWKCGSNCLYCPNDIRMPKSYLKAEPACQRAENNFFDPYLQVASRLRALRAMGHPTDKIELIILGGTWCDYPESYQIWYMTRLFAALNSGATNKLKLEAIRKRYKEAGVAHGEENLQDFAEATQEKIDKRELSYNEAFDVLYKQSQAWQEVAQFQQASLAELFALQKQNETADHRVVGLVVETRPDTISATKLKLLREFGCTKVQMGVQTLDESVAALNQRRINTRTVEQAFHLVRLFGFKIHAHFMVNLFGSDAKKDRADYERFMTQSAFQPDEVKIYPCSLVAGTDLVKEYENGTWKPYSEEELVGVLVDDIFATPAFTRVSRMIRDISSHDIVAGNKKTNLRQMVEEAIQKTGRPVQEMRYRELNNQDAPADDLRLECVSYRTTHTQEHFLQWVTSDNRLVGFLRLSLPLPSAFEEYGEDLPVSPRDAMIREVHVYGKAATISEAEQNGQHRGLGRKLVEQACEIAKEAGYEQLHVISGIGTREYYRKLGFSSFSDNGLYQTRTL